MINLYLKENITDMNKKVNELEIKGYASCFGVRDLAGDTVSPGAFSASLLHRGAGKIRMLFQHDASEPVGVWDVMREDRKGLYVEGRVFAAGPRGKTATRLIERGALDGLSIGFRTIRANSMRHGRTLYEIDLWEVSIVTFPMLPQARLSIAGAGQDHVANPRSFLQAG